MAKEKKYNVNICMLLSTMGYSYEDIAYVYSKKTGTSSNKSAISKILKNKNIKKAEVRINPRRLNQETINMLQKEGVFLPLLELYTNKYIKPVKDTKFKRK